MMNSGSRAARRAAALLLALVATAAQAQTYPAKPVRVIIPFAVNGGADVVARAVVQKMEVGLGQPVLLDNRPGANGALGTQIAAKSPADGYTLLIGMTGTMVVSPSANDRLEYDAVRDFIPVGMITIIPSVLAVHPSLKTRSLTELLALLRSRPGALTYASAGNGGPQHLTAELFKAAAGVNVVQIPYATTRPAMEDLMQGKVSMMFLSTPMVLAYVKGGELDLLAVTSREGIAALPLPTLDSSGLPGFDAALWYGLFAPAGTPPEAVRRLNTELNAAIGQPDVIAVLTRQGGRASPGTPAELGERLAADRARWGGLIKAIGYREQ